MGAPSRITKINLLLWQNIGIYADLSFKMIQPQAD